MAIAALDEASFNHDVELLVIDNGSSDNTAEVLAHIEPLNMTLRYLSEPTAGVCRAKNLGVRNANGEILVFTDDDCQVAPQYFDDLMRHYARDNQPVIRGGRVDLGDPMDAAITVKTDSQRAILTNEQHPGGFVHGCNLTMAKAVFDKIGPWDERFGPGAEFIAAEDTEMNYRALKSGVMVEYVPDMATRHFHGRRTINSIAELTRQYQTGNGALLGKYPDKNLGKHLFWYGRNWMREMAGGPLFDECLGISHRQIFLCQVSGMIKYWKTTLKSAHISNILPFEQEAIGVTSAISHEMERKYGRPHSVARPTCSSDRAADATLTNPRRQYENLRHNRKRKAVSCNPDDNRK